MHYLPAYFCCVYLKVIWEGYGYTSNWNYKKRKKKKAEIAILSFLSCLGC